jgi:hypothetical protein
MPGSFGIPTCLTIALYMVISVAIRSTTENRIKTVFTKARVNPREAFVDVVDNMQ